MAGGTAARAGWRGPFLRALERGASASNAAHGAKVHLTNAYRKKRKDSAFAAEWDAAAARGRDAMPADGGPPTLADDEVVRSSPAGRSCIARAGAGRWSAGKEALFLETLAMTGNVSAAVRATGLSSAAIYKRRYAWPGFREAWDEALAEGWRRMEELLVRAANATLGGVVGGGAGGGAGAGERPVPADPEGLAGPRMTVDQAITVYGMHRRAVTGEGRRARHDWRRKEVSLEQVRDDVLRRLRALGG